MRHRSDKTSAEQALEYARDLRVVEQQLILHEVAHYDRTDRDEVVVCTCGHESDEAGHYNHRASQIVTALLDPTTPSPAVLLGVPTPACGAPGGGQHYGLACNLPAGHPSVHRRGEWAW